MRTLALALLLLAACSKPDVAPALDQYNCDGGLCPDPGVIEGSLVYAGPMRGDAVLLLFDTQSLPPPQGTATTPTSIVRISKQTLFGPQIGTSSVLETGFGLVVSLKGSAFHDHFWPPSVERATPQ